MEVPMYLETFNIFNLIFILTFEEYPGMVGETYEQVTLYVYDFKKNERKEIKYREAINLIREADFKIEDPDREKDLKAFFEFISNVSPLAERRRNEDVRSEIESIIR